MALTDIRISDEIVISHQCMHSSKRNRALDTALLVNRTLNALKRYINTPPGMKVRIASLGPWGKYENSTKTIHLSYKLPWRSALEVLAHEMVHAEQFLENRLSLGFRRGKAYFKWEGKWCGNRGTTYQSYRAQPWEQEAFDRQCMLADWVCDDLDEQYGQSA